MLKLSHHHSKLLTTLQTTLPDDRPITSIQIVEYIDKCPEGFFAISKTHDQDQDADLWREPSFLKRKSGRYLCLSKTEGLPNFVVQEITILNEKSLPPEGFSLLNRTADTEQKAWRKRQLCYRLAKGVRGVRAITDIIVCSRLKKAPEGFTLAGEINGMTVCYKMGNVQITADNPNMPSVIPGEQPPAHTRPPPPPRPGAQPVYPPLAGDTAAAANDHDYEMLLPNYQPNRPAPRPPVPAQPPVQPHNHHDRNYSTLAVFHGLEGVPFVLSSKLASGARDTCKLPLVKARTMQQLMKDYNYDFSIERQS